MFGMGNDELCSIYRVNIDSEKVIESTWINDSGEIVYFNYENNNKDNKLPPFKLNQSANSPSFHWASCVFIAKNDDIYDNALIPPAQTFDFSDENPEFKGKVAVYSTGAVVQNCTDLYGAERDCENSQRFPSVIFKGSKKTVQPRIIKGKLPSDLSMYKRPHIETVDFTEKKEL